MKKLMFAPVQGNTVSAYRRLHREIYGGNIQYFTPFIRWENGGVRPKDIKDFKDDLRDGEPLVPQIIFRNEDELYGLTESLANEGAKAINLNMGCPFPLQTGHGRGAAAIANRELAEAVANIVSTHTEIQFSVKMRLGFKKPDEWRYLLERLNSVKLDHIAIHPRVAKQQYSGDIDFINFSRIVVDSINPVVYNGDLRTPSDIKGIFERFPDVHGVMCGRGLLARPSLYVEYEEGSEWTVKKRVGRMLEFHDRLLGIYVSSLCGDAQVLSKIKPFWEYAEQEIGRKAWKQIKKSSNMAKYQSAVAIIRNELQSL